MKVYRIMSSEEINQGLEDKVFMPKWEYYPENNGWGIINQRSCYNTFNDKQNQNLHFFRFAIDAVQYLNFDRKSFVRGLDTGYYLCVFYFPDELLEKGYGFYPNKITSEYVVKGEVKLDYLVSYSNSREEMFKKVLEELDDTIYWYSTTGKACMMLADPSFCVNQVCGTYTTGGFVSVFGRWFYDIANWFITEENVDKLKEHCNSLNKRAYEETTILEDMKNMYELHKNYKQCSNCNEVNEMFNSFEFKYEKTNLDLGSKANERIKKEKFYNY